MPYSLLRCKRPIRDIRHPLCMLQSQPTFRSFAAIAKSRGRRTGNVRTKLPSHVDQSMTAHNPKRALSTEPTDFRCVDCVSFRCKRPDVRSYAPKCCRRHWNQAAKPGSDLRQVSRGGAKTSSTLAPPCPALKPYATSSGIRHVTRTDRHNNAALNACAADMEQHAPPLLRMRVDVVP